jgi:very-short-patch-repair endonuclease/predicted transcriptional regulator of viral defense system
VTEIDLALARLAERQHGLITRRQAMALGLSSSTIERRRRRGQWIVVAPGVYRIHGAPDTWLSRLMARCLAYDGVASHRTAAYLHGLSGFRPSVLEISVPRGRSVRRDEVIMHESTDLHLMVPDTIQSIPTTPISRLVVDLGAVIPFERYNQVFDELIRRDLITWTGALDQLVRHARRGRNGVGALRAVLDERFQADVGDSALEGAFIRELRRRGLLEPVGQHVVRDELGFIARVDYAYPDLKIAIELDGRAFHGDQVFEVDRDKRLRLTAAGWYVLEITWTMLHGNPDKVFRRLTKVIEQRQRSAA